MSELPQRRAQLDRRDQFLYWWPVTARLSGLSIAAASMAFVDVGKLPSIMAFAGALVVAPNIFDAQKKRNARRNSEEE